MQYEDQYQMAHETARDHSSYAWRQVNIEDLELSVRTTHALLNAGINTLGDLLTSHWTAAELMRIPNFGRKSLAELRDLVHSFGRTLGTDSPLPPPPKMVARKTVNVFTNGISILALGDDNTLWVLREQGWQRLPALPQREEPHDPDPC